MKSALGLVLSVSVGLLALPGRALPAGPARDSTPDHGGSAPAQESAAARAYFSDVVLLNQDGQPMRFYSDLLRGKVVVISSFYTNCANACPVLSGKLARIQEALGDRMGKEVHLLSLTVDPLFDTPPRLKEYAGRFRAQSGWYFLTGDRENVGRALSKVGHSVREKEGHSNIVIIGNERTGLWKKAFGLAKTEDLIRIVDGVLNDK